MKLYLFLINISQINFCVLGIRQDVYYMSSPIQKISGATVKPYQKPILLYMKHIMCWSNFGDLIVDATSGAGTLAVKLFCLFAI